MSNTLPEASDLSYASVPLSGMRRAVARNMSAAWQVPRVAQSLEADASVIERMRAALQASLADTTKVTLTAYVLRAAALTLRDHPRINVNVAADEIRMFNDVNIGVAVSLEDGLMVPVLRQADQKSIPEICREVKMLAEGARAGTLRPAAYQRGTFTISNLGMTDVECFTPILNAPQAAILGVTRVMARAVVRDGDVVVAPMMGLHLVFDHRVIDGYPAARFLTDLKHRIETGNGLD